jgi:hypothetical protein
MTALVVAMCGADGVAAEPEKWFYGYVDLQRERPRAGDEVSLGTEDLVELLPELKQIGYSAVVLSDYYLASIGRLDGTRPESSEYLKNLERVRAAAEQYGIEIIPEVMSVGSSGQILHNNANLAEGVPVVDCEFVVSGTGALVADLKSQENSVVAGDFEADEETVARLFSIPMDGFEFSAETMDESGQSIVIEDASKGVWLSQQGVSLRKKTQYTWSFEMKTEGLKGNGNEAPLLYSIVSVNDPDHGVRKLHRVGHSVKECDGKWHRFTVSLNSFVYDRAEVAIGLEYAGAGKVWIDNVSVRQARGVNLLRRDDLPVVVQTSDGSELVEGQDYAWWSTEVCESDPSICVGFDGFYFPEDAVCPIEILPESGLKAGDELLVSYYHAQLPDAESHRVCCSLLHPGVLEIHRSQIRLLNRLLAPKRWFVNHDEIRAVGYEPDAIKAGHTPGTLLRQHLIQCLKIIQEEGGNRPVVLNSDMYDPFQNAVDQSHRGSYYPMVNGSFAGSWLPVSDDELSNCPTISIWNWNLADGDPDKLQQHVKSSFTHFKGLGYSQIVGGYYDVADGVAEKYTDQLFRMAKLHGGDVSAVCYYTAKRKLAHLKQFAKTADTVWSEE